MSDRAGHYLEQSVSVLFKKAGFKTKLNSRIKSYEIDVLAEKNNYRIAIECKQYERAHITIRNILHQWASKKNIINVNKIIIAIAGQKPKKEDYTLAEELDLVLIDSDELNRLNLILDKEKLIYELNNLIKFDEKLYNGVHRKKIIKDILGAATMILVFILLYYQFGKNFLKDIFWIVLAIIIGVILVNNTKHKRKR